MIKKIYRIILYILTVILIAGCAKKITPVTVEKEKVVTVTQTDTVVKVDESTITALLQCDSAGNVYLKKINQLQGLVTSLSLELDSNKLKVKSDGKMLINTTDKQTYEAEKEVITKYIKVEKKLTKMQELQMKVGRVVLIAIPVLLVIVIAYFLMKGIFGGYMAIIKSMFKGLLNTITNIFKTK